MNDYHTVLGNKFAHVAVKGLVKNTCAKYPHVNEEELRKTLLQIFSKGHLDWVEALRLTEVVCSE